MIYAGAGTLLDDLLPFDFGYSLGVPVPRMN